ncbi:MAG TPA: CHAT domain-containing tetratricopeptide repeat protein [Planktothrix sp.]|jgi:CHAT domain-containing protein
MRRALTLFLVLLILSTALPAAQCKTASFSKAIRLLEAEDYENAEAALRDNLSQPGTSESDVRATASTYAALSRLLFETRRTKEAQSVAQEGLDACQNKLGSKDPKVLELRYRVLQAALELEQYERSEQLANDLIRDSSPRSSVNSLAKTVLARLDLMAMKYDEGGSLLTQALAALDKEVGPADSDVVAARTDAALTYSDRAYNDKALQLVSKAVQSVEAKYGASHPRTASVKLHLALYYIGNDDEKALLLCDDALKILRQHCSDDSLPILDALSLNGEILQDHDDNAKSELLLQQALTLRKQKNLTNDDGYCDLLRNFGDLRLAQSDDKQAESFYRQALEFQNGFRGSQSIECARVMRDLAVSLSRQKRFSEAEAIYKQASEITSRFVPVVAAITSLRLAKLYADDLHKPELAEPLLVAIIPIIRKAYAPTNKTTPYVLRELAAVYKAEGKNEECKRTITDAIEMCSSKEADSIKRNLLSDLGWIDFRMQDNAGAEKAYKDRLALNEKLYGPSSDQTLVALEDLAALYYITKQSALAVATNKKRLQISIQAHGASNAFEFFALKDLGSVESDMHEWGDAEAATRQSVIVAKQVYGESDPKVAEGLLDLARIQRQAHAYDEALQSAREAANVYAAVKDKSVDDSDCYMLLGIIELEQRKPHEGRDYFERAIADEIKNHGENSSEVADLLDRAAENFDAFTKPQFANNQYNLEQAFDYRMKLLHLKESSVKPTDPSLLPLISFLCKHVSSVKGPVIPLYLKLVENLKVNKPNSAELREAYQFLGMAYEQHKERAKAIQALREQVKLQIQQTPTQSALVDSLSYLIKLSEEQRDHASVVELRRQIEQYSTWRYEYCNAKNFAFTGNIIEAKRSAQTATLLCRRLADKSEELGDCLALQAVIAELSGDSHSAEPLYREATAVYTAMLPKNATKRLQTALQLATVQWRNGDTKAAESCYKGVLDLTPGSTNHRWVIGLAFPEPNYSNLDQLLAKCTENSVVAVEKVRRLASCVDDGTHNQLALSLYSFTSKFQHEDPNADKKNEYLFLARQADARQHKFFRKMILQQISECINRPEHRDLNLTRQAALLLASLEPESNLATAEKFDALLGRLRSDDKLGAYRFWFTAEANARNRQYVEATTLYSLALDRAHRILGDSFDYHNLVFVTGHDVEPFDLTIAGQIYQRNVGREADGPRIGSLPGGGEFAVARLAGIAIKLGSQNVYPSMDFAAGLANVYRSKPVQSSSNSEEYAAQLNRILACGKTEFASASAESDIWAMYMYELDGRRREAAASAFDLSAIGDGIELKRGVENIDSEMFEAAIFCHECGENFTERRLLADIKTNAERRNDEAMIIQATLQLAELALSEHDYSSAANLAAEVSTLSKNQPGAATLVGWRLFVLARIADAQGDLESAKHDAERSTTLGSKNAIASEIQKSRAFLLLADIHMRQRNFEVAGKCLADAQVLTDKLPLEPRVVRLKVEFLTASAQLGLTQHDYPKALSFAQQSIDLLSKLRIGDSENLSVAANNLKAIIEWHSGNEKEARSLFLDGADRLNAMCLRVFTHLSFSEQSAFVGILEEQKNLLLTFCNDNDSLPEALKYLSVWKGLLIEGLREQSIAIHFTGDDATASKLTALRASLAQAYSNSSIQKSSISDEIEEQERRLMYTYYAHSTLSDELEAQISSGNKKNSPSLKTQKANAKPHRPEPHSYKTEYYRDIVAQLSNELQNANVALGQFIEGERVSSEKRLMGDVLDHNMLTNLKSNLTSDSIFLSCYEFTNVLSGRREYAVTAVGSPASNLPNPEIAYIGSADSVDKDIRSWLAIATHGQVRAGSESTVGLTQEAALGQQRSIRPVDGSPLNQANPNNSEDLLEAVWRPIEKLIPETTSHIWFSPDGELARVPWNAVFGDVSGKKNLRISQVDSPRQLFEMLTLNPDADRKSVPKAANKILLVGGLNFIEAPELPGTGVEINAIASICKSNGLTVVELDGTSGTRENVLKEMPGSKYIHLATHGYFNESAHGVRSDRETQTLVAMNLRSVHDSAHTDEALANRNMLLRSGILLAPSSSAPEQIQRRDGHLSAAEIAGVNLTGCQLVTLSACESGRGEQVTGQGVIGLRASVISAGARNVLMSLWSVDDVATERLMTLLYSNMESKKMRPSDALRQAQMQLKDDAQFADPYYWAPWVIVGSD